MSKFYITPNITDAITGACETEEEVQEFLKELMLIDWKPLLHKRDQERHLRKCQSCFEWKDGRTFKTVRFKHHARFDIAYICIECTQKMKHTLKCTICSKVLLSDYVDNNFTCAKCYENIYLIDSNNSRARKFNVPATLTLAEWDSIVKHFNAMCAYCGGIYECLEHYRPIPTGGTTKDNCLPSCRKCNSTKGNKTPEKFTKLFPPANIERINQWLASQETNLAKK